MEYVKFRVKGQKRSLKEVIIDASNDMRIWWSENKEWAIVVLPVALGGGTWLVKKVVNGSIDIAKLLIENRRIARRAYDPSTGVYLTLRHKLTNNEAIKLAELRKTMSVTEALELMRLI